MLTRSVVAALCGALAVAGFQLQQDQNGPVQHFVDPYRNIEQENLGGPQPPVAPIRQALFPEDDDPKQPLAQAPSLPHPPHGPHVENKTIYQALKEDSRFTRVFKLVNYTEDITSLLNDSSASVTFFAVPDKALQPPKHHRKHAPHNLGFNFDSPDVDPLYNTFAAELSSTSDELDLFSIVEGFVDYELVDDDDSDKERKRKIIKQIVTAVLKYHILPSELPADQLATNNTFSSALKLGEGSLDSEALRVRISSVPSLIHPQFKVNFYASLLFADVHTENGIVHVINHPLFPPPSIFTILFAFSDVFSTLTSALQRVNITDAVDWHWVRSSKTLEGSPALTLFAPTNEAFRVLPRKLKFYLFSPFGARALKKILSYHVVPDYVFHSNWAHNASDGLTALSQSREDLDMFDDPYSFIRTDYFDEIAEELQNTEDDDIVDAQIYRMQLQAKMGKPKISTAHFDESGVWCEYEWPEGRRDCRLVDGSLSCASSPPSFGASRLHLARMSQCHSADGARSFQHPRFPGPQDPRRSPSTHPRHHLPHPKPVYSLNATLPSLLANHTLDVHVAQFHSILPHGGYVTKVFVNGQWVVVPDVPTRNGAVHVVKRLIRPFRKSHPGHKMENTEWFHAAGVDEDPDHEWDDWEEWLPQWANED